MRTPVPIPRHRPQPRSFRSLMSACERAGIPYAPSLWNAVDVGEVFLKLLIAGVDHQFVGAPAFYDAILTTAPREARVTTCQCGGRVVASSPAPRRRRRRGSA